MHLPPAVKHLLKLRNPHPFPCPSPVKLGKLFAATHKDAVAKNAETGWLVLTVGNCKITLSGLDQHELVH